MRRIGFVAILVVLPSYNAFAADPNGYTARYECHAGGLLCNVDVTSLVAQDCQQTITPFDGRSVVAAKMNSGARFICIEPGDYTSLGQVTITTSGTASAYKVLRYTRSGDNNDNPWSQSAANRAVLVSIDFNNQAYWLVHRLTFNGNGESSIPLWFAANGTANNIIINRVLAENYDNVLLHIKYGSHHEITLQNSVLRDTKQNKNQENNCVHLGTGSTNIRIVNNELYNCTKAIFFAGGGGYVDRVTVENNDLYITKERYTDCNGTYTPTGPCSDTETLISMKGGSSSTANMSRIFQNRFWGMRSSDGILGDLGGGMLMTLSNDSTLSTKEPGADYTLVQNNIFMDAQKGIENFWPGPDHNSIIGNLFYDINSFGLSMVDSAAIAFVRIKNSEVYLNTIIDARGDSGWFWMRTEAENNDVRCNVVINSTDRTGNLGLGSAVSFNAFFGTPHFSTDNLNNDFVFEAVADAKHVQYCFMRKLQTGPEQVCIPNVRPTSGSPHTKACDPNIGSRPNIGVNDKPLF